MDYMADNYSTIDYDYTDPPDWSLEGTLDHTNKEIKPIDDQLVKSLRLLYVSAYSFALLGLLLNLAVIVALFKYKPKLARWTQILGLAITHLIRCLFLPLSLIRAFNSFSWEFGSAMCKLGSYVTFVNMFSTTLIIILWNVRWCVPNKCLPDVSGSTVLLSWFLGAVLAGPSLFTMEMQKNYGMNRTICIENYDFNTQKAVTVSRFFFGLVFPIFVILVSRVISRRETPVLWPVTISHFICWAPVLLLSVVQVAGINVSPYGFPVCTVLSVFNSCICPLICLWKGKEEADTSSDTKEDCTSSTYKDKQESSL